MSDSLFPPAVRSFVEEAPAGKRFLLVVTPQALEQRWHALLLPETAATPLEFTEPFELLRYLTQPATTSPTPPPDRSPHDAVQGRGLR